MEFFVPHGNRNVFLYRNKDKALEEGFYAFEKDVRWAYRIEPWGNIGVDAIIREERDELKRTGELRQLPDFRGGIKGDRYFKVLQQPVIE